MFMSLHLCASKNDSLFVQQVLFCGNVLFLRDFTPDYIVLNSHSALATSQDHEYHFYKTTARGQNYLETTFELFVTLSFFQRA